MAGFAAQVWVLCVIAFLLGSGVTWALFVRPLRAARAAVPPPQPPARAAAAPPPAAEPPAAPPPAPAVDPALTALDGVLRPTPPPGIRAVGALDLLGVARRPMIPPQQAGPPRGGPER